jgi:hypothetical protein
MALIALLTAACGGNAAQQAQSVTATFTLAPIVSMTPRFTATPVPTRTPLPTDTPIPPTATVSPTPSNTFTPSPTPPIVGIIASINTVNVREGPGVNFGAFIALPPGTRVEVLGQNSDGAWYNIQLEDGRDGWVSSTLLRLQETPTPIPTATPSPDLTALALGTTLPTAVLGGGTVTPTPPRSVTTPTAIVTVQVQPTGSVTSFLPVIDVDSINQTATALAGGVIAPSLTPTGQSGSTSIPTPAPNGTVTLASGAPTTSASAQQGVDVLAYCNDPAYRTPPPSNLAAGSTVDVWWSWFAKTEEQVRDHIANAVYTVTLDDETLENLNVYRSSIRQQSDGNYYVYWYVPSDPLSAGQHTVTFNLTWQSAISDGYATFGPGTSNPQQTGGCTFTVR